MKYILMMSLCAVVHAVTYPPGFDTNICTPPNNNGGKEIPALPPDFVAKIEFNDYADRSSMFISQYLSTTNNIGVMYVNGLDGTGDTYKLITSAITGELFFIADSFGNDAPSCRAVNLSQARSESFAFPVTENKEYPGTFDINLAALMYRGATPVGPMRYNGTEMMNGVLCDVWYGCLLSPDKKETLAATYHFSEQSWSTASGYKPVPVRMHFSSKPLSGDSDRVGQIYNYAYFSTTWPSTNPDFFYRTFQTPEHVYCEGRKNSFPLPTLPRTFSFEAEVLDSHKGTVRYVKEFFNSKLNYTRFDYDIGSKRTSKMMTEINDFGTGVSYHIDQSTNKCTITTTTSGPFSKKTPSGPVRMRTSAEFFYMDDLDKYPYQYTGERLVRGVPCNSWISMRPYPGADSGVMAAFEWYFMANGSVLATDNRAEVMEPFQFVVNAYTMDKQVTYNILKFTEGPQSVDNYDVSSCYNQTDKRTFNMRLTGNNTEFKPPVNTDLLSSMLRLSVQAFANVRPIRIQNVQFNFSGKYLETTFTVLDIVKLNGDTVNPFHEAALSLAVDRIRSAFNNGLFQFYYIDKPVTVFSPVQDSLSIME